MKKVVLWDKLYQQGRQYAAFSRVLLDRILEDYKPMRHDALDVGCGTGQLAHLIRQAGFKQVMGIDLSPTAIRAASELDDQVEFAVGDIMDYSFGSRRFDLITCKLVWAFIDDRPRFLERVKSLLQPDGLFILCTPVMLGRYEYDSRARGIAVDYADSTELLRRSFKQVTIYDESFFDEAQVLVTYTMTR